MKLFLEFQIFLLYYNWLLRNYLIMFNENNVQVRQIIGYF